MLFYYINLLLLVLTGFFLKSKKIKNYKHIFLGIAFTQLLFIYTLRAYTVGFDSVSYVEVFKSSNEIENIFSHWFEFGYVFLNKLVRSFTSRYIGLWFVIGSITLFITMRFFYKYSKNVVFSVALYVLLGYYTQGMNQIRTAIAIAICYIAFEKIHKKQYVQALFIIIAACCLHKSAVVFVFFLVTVYLFKKINWITISFFGGAAIFVFFTFDFFISFLSKYFYSQYFEEGHLMKHLQGGNLKMFLIYLAFTALGILYHKSYMQDKEESQKRTYEMVLMAMVFVCILQFLSIKLRMIARFAGYFEVYSCILLPEIVYGLKNKANRKFWFVTICVCTFLFSVIYFRFSENGLGHDGVIPYEFFWQRE